jgi:hypothetical protein
MLAFPVAAAGAAGGLLLANGIVKKERADLDLRLRDLVDRKIIDAARASQFAARANSVSVAGSWR